MALTTSSSLIRLGNLMSAGNKDLTQTFSSTGLPSLPLGTMSFMNDQVGGLRVFRFGRIMTAQTPGACVQRVALKTGTVTGTVGIGNDTTHLAASALAATAGDEVGKILQVNVSGGAAPEGECGIVVANAATSVTLDPLYPLSVNIAIGGTFSMWARDVWTDGTLDTNRVDVGGIVIGTPAAKEFGWCQVYGFHPAVQKNPAIAATADAAGCCGAKVVSIKAAETYEDYIGYAPMATSATAVQMGFVIDLWHQSMPIA